MVKIGLTGNIGSGKSYAFRFFLAKKISGISVDSINTELRNHCKFIATLLQKILRRNVLNKNELIDPTLLRRAIFSSRSARQDTENLLHPIILENLELQAMLLPENNYCIFEIPLLYEADLLATVDTVLLITADRTTLVRRLAHRDQLSPKEADNILDNQTADKNKFQNSDDIIVNNTTSEAFETCLNLIHKKYA